MHRTAQDLDEEYQSRTIKTKSNYDKRSIVQDTNNHASHTDDQSPSRQSHTIQHHEVKVRNLGWQRNDDDDNSNAAVGARRVGDDRSDGEGGSMGFQLPDRNQTGRERETANDSFKEQRRPAYNTRPNISQQSTPLQQTLRSPKVDHAPNPTRYTVSSNSRTCVLDINISINLGGRTPQVSVDANNVTSRSQPIRSTATIEDVRFIDLDLRCSPDRTAQLATDGILRQTTPKQTTNFSHDNVNRSPDRVTRNLSDGIPYILPSKQPTHYHHDNHK